MPTTSNFGWTTPADTDLVKDGAAAIRTLGNGIDTSFLDLKGGTSGQVLAKNSNTDLDFVWVAQDDSNAIQNAIVDAKGDLISATAADVPARLAVGANGTVLTADSAEATGLKWVAPATGGGMTLISEQTASASSSLTFGSISGSYKQLMLIWSGIYVSALGNVFSLRFNNDSGTNYSVFNADFYADPLNAAGSAATAGLNTATDATNTVTFSNGPFGYNTTSSTLYNKQSQGTLIIDNYASTSKFKYYTVDWSHYIDGETTGVSSFVKGVYKSTSAITSLDIFRQTGAGTITNNTSTSIRLYGIS